MNWKPGDHAMTVTHKGARTWNTSWLGREVIVGERYMGPLLHLLVPGLAYWHITFVGEAPVGAQNPIASELNLAPMPPPKEEPLPPRSDYIHPDVREIFEAPKRQRQKVEAEFTRVLHLALLRAGYL